MDFIERYRPIAEFIYFVSGPLVLIGVIATFLQLLAFKKDSITRFKRETIITTMDILERKLVQISEHYGDAFSYPSYPESPQPNVEITGHSSKHNTFNPDWIAWYTHEDNLDFYNNISNTLNDLESLAQYIYSGVTDEEMCFKLEHTSVIYYINELLPYIVQSRSDDEDHMYENIVRLHKEWTAKLHHDKTRKELIRTTEALNANPRPKSEKPIGL